jgi:uncharacterized phage-associated protein
MREIRFKFRPEKAFAAIHWMVRQRPGLDLHALLKACYFADKAHLNTFGRPIFGATYRAMRFGPVPIEIYEMAKGEALWLSEVQRDRYPWTLEGYRLRLTANDDPDSTALSDSDWEVLASALARSSSMSFDERTAATHGPDWQAAELGIMKYEDMLDDTAEKAVIVERLRENGRFMRL